MEPRVFNDLRDMLGRERAQKVRKASDDLERIVALVNGGKLCDEHAREAREQLDEAMSYVDAAKLLAEAQEAEEKWTLDVRRRQAVFDLERVYLAGVTVRERMALDDPSRSTVTRNLGGLRRAVEKAKTAKLNNRWRTFLIRQRQRARMR